VGPWLNKGWDWATDELRRAQISGRAKRISQGMPKLRDMEIDYGEIKGLVCQLAFEQKLSLIKELVTDKSYERK